MVTLLKAGIRSRDISLVKRVVEVLGEKASLHGRAALLTGSGVMILRNRSYDSSVGHSRSTSWFFDGLRQS